MTPNNPIMVHNSVLVQHQQLLQNFPDSGLPYINIWFCMILQLDILNIYLNSISIPFSYMHILIYFIIIVKSKFHLQQLEVFYIFLLKCFKATLSFHKLIPKNAQMTTLYIHVRRKECYLVRLIS